MKDVLIHTALAGMGGTGLWGALAALLPRHAEERLTSLLLSFAAGVMTALVCLDLLPEALEAGGLVRLALEKRKYTSEKAKNDCIQSGILYTSGMIAGEGVVGILLAVFAVLGINLDLSGSVNLGNIGGLVLFAGLLATIVLFANKGAKESK